MLGTVVTHAINGALFAKMPYDKVKDFAPVSLVATTPNMLVVNNVVPARTLRELMDLGKREGRLCALGVTSLKHSAAAPDIPTLAEAGLPGFEAVSWFAVFVPAATPRPVVDKLQFEITRILKLPEIT